MREYLTYDDICNEISMTRSVYDGLVMVVEGVTDLRLYRKFADKDHVQIFVAHSKDNVREVVRFMTKNRHDKRVFGIIDADLDRLKHKKPKRPLFHTDCRDMEMMVIRSNAFQDVMDEYGEESSVERFEKSVGPVKDALISASYPIGLLMYVSDRNGLSLRFKDLDFERFINPHTLTLDARAMVADVVNNSNSSRVSKKMLYRLLNDAAAELDDQWDAARGHDTVEILLIGLRRNFGSFNSKNLTPGELGGSLRLAFSDRDFVKTRLYQDTKEWAETTGLTLWNIFS